MLKKTLVSLAVAGSLYLSPLHALELGELTAISKVNEPFKAEIQLLDVNSLTPKDIIVQLGTESEFLQAGIAPDQVLSRLKFQTRKKSDGGFVVDVVTLTAIAVDELSFVLSARWPNGKVVREYRVPLVEPVLSETGASPKVISAPAVTKATDSSTDNRELLQKTATTSESLTVEDFLNSMPTKGTRNIQQGDTLWAVASGNTPSEQLTIYQTMMAIQSLNQDAFYANNVNLMKEGAILRLPTKEQIELFNAVLSKKEFDMQVQAWRNLKQNGRIASEIEAAQLNTQAESKPAAKVPPVNDDVLSLIAGASILPEEEASSNEANQQAQATINELTNKLSAVEENLDKETREKAELSEKIQDLNDQLSTLEELIALKDIQLAELQAQLETAQNVIQEQKNTVDQLLEADQLRRERELEEANTLLNKFLTNPLYLSISSVLLMLLGIMLGLLLKRGGKNTDPKHYTGEDDLSDFSMSNSTAQTAAAMAAVAAPEVNNVDEDIDDVEDDPFAFDFDSPDESPDELDTDFDSDVADDDFGDMESSFEEDEDDIDFDFDMDDAEDLEDVASLEETDEPIDEEGIPTIDDSIDSEVEETELATEDDEGFIDIEDDGADDMLEVVDSSEEMDAEATGGDEDFVNNLLDDSDLQEDPDESALFEMDPSDSLANSIEETLSESMDIEEAGELEETVEFTTEEAAEDIEESDEEENIDFFDASGDEVATKLDLARAYVDMGDEEGARVILEEVLEIGSEEQIGDAQKMIDRMSPSEE